MAEEYSMLRKKRTGGSVERSTANGRHKGAWRRFGAAATSAAMATLMFLAVGPGAARADNGSIIRTVTAQSPSCSVGTGLAFDGKQLLLDCWNQNQIWGVSPADGALLNTYTIAGASDLRAMAWDRGRRKLWVCNSDADVYLADLAAQTETFAFTSQGCVDGLAYDGTDDTIWSSDDAASTVQHYTSSGTLISSTDITGKLGGCGNSGIAVGGAKLLLSNNGCSQIYVATKDLASTTLFGTYPARLEDMECDDVTFAASGQAAIWSKDAYDNTLNAFDLVPGTCGFGGQPSTPQRYVALGDSVPYGHGLANPGKDRQGALAPDQPPSPDAYPSLLAKSLGYNFTIRKDGCTLTGDQLAVSGAPSIDNKWTGKDADCRYPKGVPVPLQKAVSPNEVLAADLKNHPPSLVTLQAGADDVDFAACLASLLSAPANPFMHVENCVDQDRKGNYVVTQKFATELKSLKDGLTKTLDAVHDAAPAAQILLLDYYQIIPGADADLAGSSFICRDLRFSKQGGKWRTSIRAKADFLQKTLNSTIGAAATGRAYVKTVDISSAFSGHEMCTKSTWVFDGTWNAAHPTKPGQQAIADAVIAVCGQLPRGCRG
ncbi:SGNH/GDSL hydrolase family protein [Amycolatopsis sp. NPDC004625]|uniref:SGNH/GDSL hydrolase family protein n=1 Tax=Amycolatopsis sp. NPDC004625 TaxID=3154670 RepID=UPI0033B7080D